MISLALSSDTRSLLKLEILTMNPPKALNFFFILFIQKAMKSTYITNQTSICVYWEEKKTKQKPQVPEGKKERKRYLCIASGFGLPCEKEKLQLLPDGDVCCCLLEERLLQGGAPLSDCSGMEPTHSVLVAGMDGDAPGRKEAVHLPVWAENGEEKLLLCRGMRRVSQTGLNFFLSLPA